MYWEIVVKLVLGMVLRVIGLEREINRRRIPHPGLHGLGIGYDVSGISYEAYPHSNPIRSAGRTGYQWNRFLGAGTI